MKVQCTKTETYTICPMTGLVKVPQRTAEAPTSATVMPTNLHCATCLVIVRVEYTLSEMHQLSHMKCCYGLSHFSDTTSKASFSPTTTRPWNCANRSLAFTLHTRPTTLLINSTGPKLLRRMPFLYSPTSSLLGRTPRRVQSKALVPLNINK